MSDTTPDTQKEEGLRLFGQGHYDEALAQFEAAAAQYAATEDESGRAEMLNNIGVVHRFKRNWKQASQVLHEAEKSFAAAGDRQRQGQVAGNLGDIYTGQRQYKEAATAYSRASDLFAKDGDREKQAQVLRSLSLVQVRQRHWIEAIYSMEHSLRVRPRLSIGQRLLVSLIRLAMKLVGR